MKIRIVLDADGVRRIAEGGQPYSFDFRAQPEQGELPKGSALMAEVEVNLPSKEECIPQTLVYIERKIAETRQTAALEIHELEVAKANLLALPAPASAPVQPAAQVAEFYDAQV